MTARCLDCVCDPLLCATDDTGEHCATAGCGACLHGCPDDEHDMRQPAREETR